MSTCDCFSTLRGISNWKNAVFTVKYQLDAAEARTKETIDQATGENPKETTGKTYEQQEPDRNCFRKCHSFREQSEYYTQSQADFALAWRPR
jgi:hypothetical protein